MISSAALEKGITLAPVFDLRERNEAPFKVDLRPFQRFDFIAATSGQHQHPDDSATLLIFCFLFHVRQHSFKPGLFSFGQIALDFAAGGYAHTGSRINRQQFFSNGIV